jgi:hypothetical protein
MRLALCTTTIHVPHALKLMRKCSEDVRFFVATDEKTPDEARDFVHRVSNTQTNGKITSSVWKCSEPIGWNTLARRNIAFLEALKWGADVIYSWDNDNLPVSLDHFEIIAKILLTRESHMVSSFNGIKVSGHDGWFDPGTLLIPPTRHRGIPHHLRPSRHAAPVTDARIGVAAGLVIGDPDIDASTRIELKPDIGAVHLLGQTGVIVDLNTWTVFNSQNTAVIRELIPAWFMMPGVGRHDDIYASLIVQRVARERGLHVHFGPPFTYQQRNNHDLLADICNEIVGMRHVEKIAAALDAFRLMPGGSVIGHTRAIYIYLASILLIPDHGFSAAMAFLEDAESVL